MPTVFPVLSYENPTDSTRRRTKHRDVAANYQLVTRLMTSGYEHGEPIFNCPADPGTPDDGELHPIDVSFVRPGDRLLWTTRPGKDDPRHLDRKHIQPARTDLEVRVFDAWSRYLEMCPRSTVKLTDAMRRLLPEAFEGRWNIIFKQARGCGYKLLHERRARRKPPAGNLTAAYLLHLAELWKGGPGLISAFGMDGTATSGWCYRLARDYSYLLEQPGFAMVEIEMEPVPVRPANLRWALKWTIRTLIDERF
jgi:hypothetical protein